VPVNRAGELLGRRVLAAVGVVLVCALAAPGFASAETFTVNSTADEVDASVGNEFCETAAGKCTLRAAIEEANSSTEAFDAISFEEGVFEGDSASVVELASALPAITAPLSLSGRECGTEAGVPGPCVEVDGVAGAPVLSLEGVAEVEIETLALTNGEAGLAADEAPRLRVRGSWLGVGLDGAAAGNGTGLHLGPGSDGSRIGGEGPGTGNLLANSGGAGLEILGSSNARVLGNTFGVTPTGAQAAPNEVNLALSSSAGAPAMDNVIGTRVSPAAAATAACDGGCNLISGSTLSGIDLTGLGGSGPPIGTAIAGNHIGLDASGTGSNPNGGAGILVGPAPRTTIGGPRPGDGNRIAGGSSAVTAGGAPYLVVRGNLIGSRASATGTAAAPQDGLRLNFEGLSLPSEEAQVLENEIGLGGGTGIALRGLGGLISGNLVEGADTGIEVEEGGSENLIDSNRVEAAGVGILVEGSFSAIVGNAILGGQKTGVRIEGSGLFGASGNVVGGDTTAAENRIDGSAGAAIEIENPRLSLNEVARNRGAGNAGLFIDLTASVPDPGDPEPGPPNRGILPPAIAAISGASAAGFAEPGALVRVFRKATPAPGEIASFLGQATADGDGNWSLAFPVPLPVGTAIAATQTLAGGTSELEIATVPPPNEGQRPPVAEPPVDRRPPRTRMLRQPRRVPQDGVARFAFTSNEPGSRFQCRLDGGKYRSCKSPQKYRGLPPGKHVFRVRAIDAAGNVDRTAVKRRFEVLG
jgi:CSLREA domain-containing protein